MGYAGRECWSSSQTFSYPQSAALGDAGLGQNQPALHEFQRYPGHPATTCLSSVFGWDLSNNSGLGRASLVQAITNAIPRISDYANGAQPAGSLNSTMGGTVAVSGTSGVLSTDMDRLYADLDEFQFTPTRVAQSMGSAAIAQEDVESCRFFLTAHSKAPELNMFGLPRVAIWPLWDQSNAAKRSTFDQEILRCATIATGTGGSSSDPHNMAVFRNDPTTGTADWQITRNPQVFGYLQKMMNTNVPGFGNSFVNKYQAADCDQLLAEIFDYIRCTNLADNSVSNGVTATPYTVSSGNGNNTGQVVPLQVSSSGGVSVTQFNGNNPRGAGRIATVAELDLELVKVEDRINPKLAETGSNTCPIVNITNAYESGSTTAIHPTNIALTPNTAVEWALIPRFFSPMAGYVGLANNLQMKFNFATANPLKVGGSAVAAPATPATLIDKGRFPSSRDSDVGGNIGAVFFLDPAAPATNMWPTGLVLVNGQTGQAMSIGGSVGWSIAAPYNGNVIQSGTFTFPTVNVPIPGLALTNGTWEGTFRAPKYTVTGSTGTFTYPQGNSGGTASRGNLRAAKGSPWNNDQFYVFSGSTHVLRAAVATGTLNKIAILGDERMIALSANLGATAYGLGTKTSGTMPTVSDYIVSSLREGDCSIGINAPTLYFSSPANGVPFSSYQFGRNTPGEMAPDIPAMSGSLQMASGIPVDFDNGMGGIFDGPLMNKPDEGMNTGGAEVPYIGDYQADEQITAPHPTLFSPNRQVSSPVMFGSLPVGLDHPWRTLLFRPATLPGYQSAAGSSYTHPGNATPQTQVPDHLLLDLFWMPVVEPYGISEPFTTAGKINLNTQIAPFTYITRTTGLNGVLKSVMLTAISPGGTASSPPGTNPFAGNYKSAYNPGNGPQPNATTRYPIDTAGTISQLTVASPDSTSAYPEFSRTSHTTTNPNFFVSASQICDLPLIPTGYTGGPKGNLSLFWTNCSMTEIIAWSARTR